MVTFLFSVHTITKAKQYAGLGRAEPGLEPGRWIFQPFDLARPGVAPLLGLTLLCNNVGWDKLLTLCESISRPIIWYRCKIYMYIYEDNGRLLKRGDSPSILNTCVFIHHRKVR